jgi:hypothetical protein
MVDSVGWFGSSKPWRLWLDRFPPSHGGPTVTTRRASTATTAVVYFPQAPSEVGFSFFPWHLDLEQDSGGKSTRTMNDRPTNSLRCARFLPDRHGLPADPHCGPCKAGLILRRVYQIEPITKHYRGMNNPFARSFNRSWIRILYSN